MKYIKMNQKGIQIIKEFRDISEEFWEIKEIKNFYAKKQYNVYKKYRNIFVQKHILYKRKN